MVSIVVTSAFCDGYKCGVTEKQTGIICRCPDSFINSEIDAWLRGHQEALYAAKGIQASNGTPQGMDFSSAFKLIRDTDFGCPTCDLQEIKDELSLYGLVKDKTCLTINTDVYVESTVCACRRDQCDGKLVRNADPECEMCKGSGCMLIRTTNTRAQRIQQ